MTDDKELEQLKRDSQRYRALRSMASHRVAQHDHPRAWNIYFCSDESTFDNATDELVGRMLMNADASEFHRARPRRSIYDDDFLNLLQREQGLKKLLSILLTVKRSNTPEWMQHLADEMNEILKSIEDKDRVVYSNDGIFKEPQHQLTKQPQGGDK